MMQLTMILAPLVLFLTTAAGEEGCPAGWINSVEGCFLFEYTKAVTWRDAQEVCESSGGFLAEIKTEEQAMLLTSLAFVEESIVGISAWWVGLTDQGHQGRWIWQHSVQDTNYTNWATDYPDYTNAEDDCVVMASRDKFMWSNTDCGGLAACPVCQREAEWSDGTTTVDQATTTAQEFHVELRGGDSIRRGNVFAVNRLGYLGPICDDIWMDTHARIVCRQLGFNSGVSRRDSFFGDVPNKFAMDYVTCAGDEDTIQQCGYNTLDNCDFNEGAGVECY